MPFTPGRGQPQVGQQQGNMLGPGPSMQHPQANASGLLPGTPAIPRGAEAWSAVDSQDFHSDGTNQVWTWQSAVFDLRPAVSASYGIISSAYPINHEAALGMSVYLVILLASRSGAVPPASVNGMTAFYFENGNNLSADTLYRLAPATEITDDVQAGGTTTVAPFGATCLSFSPIQPSLRFWQLNIQLVIPGVAPVTTDLFIQAMLH